MSAMLLYFFELLYYNKCEENIGVFDERFL